MRGNMSPGAMNFIEEASDDESMLESEEEDEEMVEVEVEEFTEVASLGSGTGFGELALINEKPRAASIICKVNTTFAVLKKNHFASILGRFEEKKLNEKITALQKFPIFQ